MKIRKSLLDCPSRGDERRKGDMHLKNEVYRFSHGRRMKKSKYKTNVTFFLGAGNRSLTPKDLSELLHYFSLHNRPVFNI